MSATIGGDKGGWKEEKLLGSGGFGAVHLWKHKNGDYIALKRCRVQHEMTVRHKQRWALEVNIMKKLDHSNVIGARDVPGELDVGADDLPLLAMEYCSGGDLRKILNKPESCCGLKEYDVRCLVKDIASAIEYLHSKRIIHRDLKPENIVLQPTEDKIIYKLIDLGYAKELDQGSVCTSFVGTLQYLAPELFASQKYTCTVDYWSFGTVVFECITGVRPFLPQSPPVQWHREVCQKSPEDICAYHDMNGDVRFSKNLPVPNYLCRTLQAYFEKWLRMMLRWDPKSRGAGLQDNRPKCFLFLETILNMKIVHILDVASNFELQVLSYPVTDSMLMSEIQQLIEKETRISVGDQDILLASGASPDPNKYATQCWNSPGDEDWVVFLFRKGEVIDSMNSRRMYKPFPPRVQDIVKESTIILPYQEMKKAWGEAVYYCAQQLSDYKKLILSQRASMLSLLRTNSEFVKLKNIMINEWEQLISKKNYFKECLKVDLDNYRYYASSSGHFVDDMYQKWMASGNNVENIDSLKENVDRLDQQAAALQTKIMELNKSPFSKISKNEKLEECEKRSRELYQELRQAGKARENVRDHKQMVQVVVKCVITRDSCLHDLFTHLSKICSCKYELSQLGPEIRQQNQELAEVNQRLLAIQKQRQEDIWRLLYSTVQNNTVIRQDSKSSNSSTEQNSLLTSMCGDSSMESHKVLTDSKHVNKKLGDIVDDMFNEQEELMSTLDWNFLSPNKNS